MKFFNRYSKVIVALVIVLNVLFAFTVLALMAFFQMPEPTELIKYWFASFTLELLSSAGITITNKIIEGKEVVKDDEEKVQ